MRYDDRRSLLVFLSVLLISTQLLGCDRRSEEAERETTTDDQHASQSSTSRPSPSAATWSRVPASKLDARQEKQLDRAEEARKAFGSRLKRALQQSVAEDAFEGAIGFCRAEAPKIARSVSREFDVEIGRTSHKLRNPDNTPPAWAEAAVERKKKRRYVFRGPDQKLASLHPIELGGLCVNCHGPEEKLAPGVEEMLAKHYPNDRATGFEIGDLRGWFWVEVPSS